MIPAFGLGIPIRLEETHCMRFAVQRGLPLIGFCTFWSQKVPKTPAAHAAATLRMGLRRLCLARLILRGCARRLFRPSGRRFFRTCWRRSSVA